MAEKNGPTPTEEMVARLERLKKTNPEMYRHIVGLLRSLPDA